MSWLWTFGKVPELSSHELQEVSKRLIALNPEERSKASTTRVIDVRTQAEFNAGHVAGALNASFLPPWSFAGRVEPLIAHLNKDTEIITICLSAHRSIGALKWLREKGFTNIKQLEGGMKAWRALQLPEATMAEAQQQ